MTKTSARVRGSVGVVMLAAGGMLAGCGYTDLEMAAKQRQIDVLVTQVNAMKAGHAAADACKSDDKPGARHASGPALSSR
jgi:hypothetical protein